MTADVPYRGTWKATQGSETWLGGSDSLTVGSPLFAPGYPFSWARLAEGGAAAGASVLSLDADDMPSPAELARVCPPKTLLVVTGSDCCGRAGQFTEDSLTAVSATMPLWIAGQSGVDEAANQAANAQAGFQGGAPGVGICEVLLVDAEGRIHLTAPLVFDHSKTYTTLTNAAGETVQVGTAHHVGVLSRTITVRGVPSSGGAGCNKLFQSKASQAYAGISNRPAQATMKHMPLLKDDDTQATDIVGPGGSITSNFGAGWAGQTVGEVFSSCYAPEARSRVSSEWQSQYTGDVQPVSPANVQGHWMFGTAGQTGCNAILGGQHFFRYGSCVCWTALKSSIWAWPPTLAQ